MESQGKKRLLSVQETASYLGIKPRSLYNRIGRKAKNRFPVRPKRIGRRVFFDIKDLDKFIDDL